MNKTSRSFSGSRAHNELSAGSRAGTLSHVRPPRRRDDPGRPNNQDQRQPARAILGAGQTAVRVSHASEGDVVNAR